MASSLHARAFSALLQAHSPSAQIKAAADQVIDRNWIREYWVIIPLGASSDKPTIQEMDTDSRFRVSTTQSSHPRGLRHFSRKRPLGPNSDYVHMLLELDAVATLRNVLALFSTWITPAGFLMLPGTFTSLERSSALQDKTLCRTSHSCALL